MKLVLNIDTNLSRKVFLRLAARGLTSTNDAGEALIVALEESVAGEDALLTDAQVAAAFTSNKGNVSRAAAELNIARSTVRARLKKASGG